MKSTFFTRNIFLLDYIIHHDKTIKFANAYCLTSRWHQITINKEPIRLFYFLFFITRSFGYDHSNPSIPGMVQGVQ